jgi:zinc/manganese transport system permease protein
MAVFYGLAGTFLYFARKPLDLCTFRPQEAQRQGVPLRLWDFLFYGTFGVVVTESVKVAGVLAVFSFLVVPIVCAALLGFEGRKKLFGAWGIGIAVSAAGTVVSYFKDLPTGAVIVCLFGGVVVLISLFTRVKNAG